MFLLQRCELDPWLLSSTIQNPNLTTKFIIFHPTQCFLKAVGNKYYNVIDYVVTAQRYILRLHRTQNSTAPVIGCAAHDR
jgi:hypothetical protein